MFEIGASLHEAREKRGLTRADVQLALRIRERYLTALEDEHWELLPGDAYARGFLRTYAEHLGLNGTLYVDEYDERIAGRDDQPFVPASLAAQRKSTILFRTVGGVIAVAVAVVALLMFSSAPAPVRLPPPVPAAPVSGR